MTRALTIVAALATAVCSPDAPPAPAPTTTVAPPEPTTTTTTAPLPSTTAVTVSPVASVPLPPPPDLPPAGAATAAPDVVAAICAAWGDECARAVRVARCESTLNPRARNGAHAGLFQVATGVHAARIARMGYTSAQMLEVGPNIAVAHALWLEQGWRPWTCAA